MSVIRLLVLACQVPQHTSMDATTEIACGAPCTHPNGQHVKPCPGLKDFSHSRRRRPCLHGRSPQPQTNRSRTKHHPSPSREYIVPVTSGCSCFAEESAAVDQHPVSPHHLARMHHPAVPQAACPNRIPNSIHQAILWCAHSCPPS